MAEYEQMLMVSRLGSAGLYQTFDRRLCGGTRTAATGVMEMSAIFLPAGLIRVIFRLMADKPPARTETSRTIRSRGNRSPQ